MATKDAKIRITAQDKTKASIHQVKRNLAGLKSAAMGVSKTLAGIAPVAGVAGFTAMAKSAIELGSRLDDTAKKLSVTTDFLQEFGFAARETGVKTTAAEMGLQRFTRRLAEAQMGKGELLPVLEQYNIALTDSEGRARSAEEVLRDYADTVKNALSPQEQLRLAFKAFDSEGAGLVTVLKNGAEGLDEWSSAAKKAGQVMSEETIATLAEAENRIERMTTRMTIWTGNLIRIGSLLGRFGKMAPELPFSGALGLLDMGEDAKPKKEPTAPPAIDTESLTSMGVLESKSQSATQSMTDLNAEIFKLNAGMFNASEAIAGVKTGFENVQVVAGEATTKTRTWMDDAAGAVTGLGYALEDGLVNAAKNGKAAFGDMAQFILAEIQRILIRSLILRPLFGAIGGFIGDNPVGNAFSSSFGGGKAGGGMVTGGKSYMVGERGPEMVTMGGNGYVTPNHKMGGDVYNIDARGADKEGLRNLENAILALNGSIENRAIAAVRNASTRKPSYI